MVDRTPLKDRVKNILGLALHDEQSMDGWTPEVRQGMALVEIAGEIDALHDNGCGAHAATCLRLTKLEMWKSWILGGVAFLVAAAAVVGFILLVAPHIK